MASWREKGNSASQLGWQTKRSLPRAVLLHGAMNPTNSTNFPTLDHGQWTMAMKSNVKIQALTPNSPSSDPEFSALQIFSWKSWIMNKVLLLLYGKLSNSKYIYTRRKSQARKWSFLAFLSFFIDILRNVWYGNIKITVNGQ